MSNYLHMSFTDLTACVRVYASSNKGLSATGQRLVLRRFSYIEKGISLPCLCHTHTHTHARITNALPAAQVTIRVGGSHGRASWFLFACLLCMLRIVTILVEHFTDHIRSHLWPKVKTFDYREFT